MKNLLLSTLLIALMAVSANTFAATKSMANEKGKTEMSARSWKNNDMRRGDMKKDSSQKKDMKRHGKKGSHHHQGNGHCCKK